MKLFRKERITNALLLNSSFIENIGLMHGKTGISIYFYLLARKTGNETYENYAGELIDEMYEEITDNTLWDFENGLAGIGWGIEYMVQNKFIEADTDEVLEEFDSRLFRQLIYSTPRDTGLLNGLLGIGFYFLMRIKNPASNDDKIQTLTNKQTLVHLLDELDRRLANEQKLKLLKVEPEAKGKKEITGRKTTFCITWDYIVLIWFLAELYEQDILNFKVEKILKKLIGLLPDDNNLPVLQSNRLLLSLALTKLSRINNTIGTTETISNHLLSDLNREAIKTELAPNNATIKIGTSGIAWVYNRLFRLTADNRFKQEMEYWLEQSLLVEEVDKGFAGFNFNNDDHSYGLLEGLAGIGLSFGTLMQFEKITF